MYNVKHYNIKKIAWAIVSSLNNVVKNVSTNPNVSKKKMFFAENSGYMTDMAIY